MSSSLSMLFFDSGLSYTGLVQAVTITVSLYVQFPCGIQRILFPYLHLLPLALRVFLSTLLPWFSLGRKVYYTDRVEKSSVSCSLNLDQLWVSVNHHTPQID